MSNLQNENLENTYYLNYEHPLIQAYVSERTKELGDLPSKAAAIYYAVRDDFPYYPYRISLVKEQLRAHVLLERKMGHCLEKSVLLCACLRALGIPSRIGLAKVTNHIGTARLEEILMSNVLVPHGYVDFLLGDTWIKLTPAFNAELCNKLNVDPLSFSATHDSIFQEYRKTGDKFMEYIDDYGSFQDLPFDRIVELLHQHYPHVFDAEAPDDFVILLE